MGRAPVELCDVTARGGRQSSDVVWPTEDKIELIRRLEAAGVTSAGSVEVWWRLADRRRPARSGEPATPGSVARHG